MHRSKILPYLFISPALVLIFVIIFYPTLYGLYLSLCSQIPGTGEFKFMGLGNFSNFLTSKDFWQSVRVTLIFSLGYVVLTVVLGLFLAIMLNQRVKFSGIYMTLLFIPWVLSPTVAAIIWRWLFNPAVGLIELTMRRLGLVGIGGILSNPWGARAIMVSLSVWQGIPFSMLLLLAGLQSISSELIDAGRIDGATHWQSFRFIIWPLLKPQLLVLLLLLTIGAINASGTFLVVTDGGPGRATEVLGIYMYHIAFRFFQLTQGSALAVIMFFINLGITLIYMRFFSSEYQR